jgi:hypothetical protein
MPTVVLSGVTVGICGATMTPVLERTVKSSLRRVGRLFGFGCPTLEPSRILVWLRVPLTLVPGERRLHDLLVKNLTDEDVTIVSNGLLIGTIIDPSTLRVIGVSRIPQTLPLVTQVARPGETVRLILAVGAESPNLKHRSTVPPGKWGVVAQLRVSGNDYLTPMMPCDIEERRP